MRRRHLVITAAVVALALGPALPAQASTLIQAKGIACASSARYVPSSVSVAKGTTVVWKSVCNKHTVTAYGGNWSKDTTIAKGQTTSRKFTSNGTFRFRCRFHSSLSSGVCSGMCGRVSVG
jgi:plastocyanin